MQGAKIHGCEAHGAGRVRYKIKKVSMDHKALEDFVIRFTEAFNQNDLEGVMALMAEEAVYEEFTGTINRGRAAIRWRGDERFDTIEAFARDVLPAFKEAVPVGG